MATCEVNEAELVEFPASTALRTESLSESVAILLLLTVVQRCIGFLRSILFCRWLSAEQLGEWDMAFGFLMLAAPLACLGLPGSFGRYVEHYRQQSQLRTFLLRTSMTTLTMAVFAVAAMAWWPRWFERLIFGDETHLSLVPLLAATLAIVIVYNFLTSLFIALRRNRVVSLMQFTASLVFASVGSALLLWSAASTRSVIAAFAVSCFVAVVLMLPWVRSIWRALPPSPGPMAHRTMWNRVLPFAFWLWLTNWLSNMFEITDRFLLVHYSGLQSASALDLVGQYHSARVLPVLLVGVAELLGAVITPHLSSDWEAGRRRRVSHRLNFIVKLFGLGLASASVAVLVGAPLLFQVGFGGKYAQGQEIIPWALMYCTWSSLSVIAFNYLWCAEKSRLVTLVLLFGLTLNVALNLVLLPAWGLWGAVIATSIAKGLSVVLLGVLSARSGMRIGSGIMLVAALPLLLPLGALPTFLGLIFVAARCWNRSERVRIASEIRRVISALRHPGSTGRGLWAR
ncbi:MAG TPA: lipopolysaccharide biosynthesis protein [Pirellulales bacterium]|jgi:O-antigen/teichoic acid export membrane protein|nr:lipopolysaccharide biosynthesis protein [Pirellulales bacterium]